MKKLIGVVLTAVLFLSACNRKNKEAAIADLVVSETGNAEAGDGYRVKIGDMAPDFTVKLTDGTDFTLNRQRGKVVLLQFTASWCGVCRREMPFIEKDIWQKHRMDPDFVLLAIDREEPLDKVLPFIESTGITYPVALDSDAGVFQLYAEKSAGITRNVLIGKDGRIVMLTRLFNEKEFEKLVHEIGRLLSEKQNDNE